MGLWSVSQGSFGFPPRGTSLSSWKCDERWVPVALVVLVLRVMYFLMPVYALVSRALMKAFGAKGAHRTRMAQVVSQREHSPMMEK